jgi:hypothetical protein
MTKGRIEPDRETSMTDLRILATTACLLVSGTAFAEDPLPRAKPEEVGLSSERLARIGETLKADIDAGRIPGAVIAIARRGKLVAFDAYGWRDKAAGLPMTTDTIFNIASMTKPMTTVGRNRAGQSSDHDPGPDAPHLGPDLWRPRQHARAQDVPGWKQRRGARL